MKKINFIIILFISALFFFPDNVFAAESLGTCVYEFSGEEIGYYARARRFSLSVTVYDDGTTGNRLFSVYDSEGNVWSDEPSSGLLLGDHGIYLQYSEGIFNQNGDFYNAYVQKNNCPTMQFIIDQTGSTRLHFNVGGGENPGNNPSITLSDVQSTGGTSGGQNSETITYCNERRKPVRNSSFGDIFITTTETNGVREFRIEFEDGAGPGVANFNQTLLVNGFEFMVAEDDYDVFWSDECEDVELYLWAPYGDNQRIIQTIKPPDEENGAFPAAQAEEDYGGEGLLLQPGIDSNATGENWNQPIGCEDIFNTSEEGSVGWVLMTLLNYVRVIGPIAVVLLSALDFIKAIMSSDEKAMKQAQSKLVIRLIAALALFLIPTLVSLLLDLINTTNCANNL